MEDVDRKKIIDYVQKLGFMSSGHMEGASFLVFELSNIRLNIASNTIWIFYKGRLEASLHGSCTSSIEMINTFLRMDGLEQFINSPGEE